MHNVGTCTGSNARALSYSSVAPAKSCETEYRKLPREHSAVEDCGWKDSARKYNSSAEACFDVHMHTDVEGTHNSVSPPRHLPHLQL